MLLCFPANLNNIAPQRSRFAELCEAGGRAAYESIQQMASTAMGAINATGRYSCWDRETTFTAVDHTAHTPDEPFLEELNRGLAILDQAGLSNNAERRIYRSALHKNPRHAVSLAKGIVRMNEPRLGRANQRRANLNTLIQNAKYAEELAEAHNILRAGGFLNGSEGQTFLDALRQNKEHAVPLAKGLRILRGAGLTRGVTGQANCNVLIFSHNAQHAIRLAITLVKFHQADLLTDDAMGQANRDALNQSAQYAEIITESIITAHQAGFITDDAQGKANRETIRLNVQHLGGFFIEVFVLLHREGFLRGDRRQINFDNLLKNAEHLGSFFVFGVGVLREVNLLTDDAERQANLDALIQNKNLPEGLEILRLNNLIGGNQGLIYVHLLIQNPKHAASLAKGLCALHRNNLLEVPEKQEIINALIQNGQNGENFAWGLIALRQKLFLVGVKGQNNFDAFLRNEEPIKSFGVGLGFLYRTGLSKEAQGQINCDALIRNVQCVKTLAEVLKISLKLLMRNEKQANFDRIISNAANPLELKILLKTLQASKDLQKLDNPQPIFNNLMDAFERGAEERALRVAKILSLGQRSATLPFELVREIMSFTMPQHLYNKNEFKTKLDELKK